MDPYTAMQIGGTVLSVVGGLKKKKTGLDLGQMRKDAEANGVNFLTLLRNTGGAGYGRAQDPNAAAAFGAGLTSIGQIGQASQLHDMDMSEAMSRNKLRDSQIIESSQRMMINAQRTRGAIAGGRQNMTTAVSVAPTGAAFDPTSRTVIVDPTLSRDYKSDALAAAADEGLMGTSETNPNMIPAFTMFGIDMVGSGSWSNGQTFEDALGDNPFTWMLSPFIAMDAVLSTGGRALGLDMNSPVKFGGLGPTWSETGAAIKKGVAPVGDAFSEFGRQFEHEAQTSRQVPDWLRRGFGQLTTNQGVGRGGAF